MVRVNAVFLVAPSVQRPGCLVTVANPFASKKYSFMGHGPVCSSLSVLMPLHFLLKRTAIAELSVVV